MKTQVTFTITADLDDIDFTDCGDGCGTVYGLHCATFKGAQIMCFSPDDVEAATEAMEDELGGKGEHIKAMHKAAQDYQHKSMRQRQYDAAQWAREQYNNDLITINRRKG